MNTRFFIVAVRAGIVTSVLLSAVPAHAEITLTLKKTFIEKYKDRATIDASCLVDHSKGQPNSPSKDGDMHLSVRCQQDIGLPAVAEFMNARDITDGVDEANRLQGSTERVSITGAWRIWNEHGGDESFKQGDTIKRATNSNPDHVFEIHPISKFGPIDASATWKPIDGYEPKAAEDAFHRYENTRSRITVGSSTITIESPGLGYNYVNFQMELNERPFPVQDGSFLFARVRDWEGHLVHRKRRMVFVKDTPPEQAVRDKGEGDCFRVLGIPRLNLSLVSWRAKPSSRHQFPNVLTWNLPYEIIVVAIYDQQCETD